MKKTIVCVSLVLLCASYAFASEVGRVTYVDGRVDALKTGSELAVPIRQGETISAGDSIRTKSGSKAEITFKDNSVLRLAQNSKVDVNQYDLNKDNSRKTATIKLDRGKARAIIAKTANAAEFNILTPNSEGKVKGSDIFISYEAGSSGILVAEGKMELKNASNPNIVLLIPEGNSALVNLEESPKGPRPYLDIEKKMYEQDTSVPMVSRRKAEDSAIRGMLAALSGAVKITAKDASSSRGASLNDIVGEGDSIETGENGLVEIKFDNGCGLNLKPNTHLKITRLVMDPKSGEYQNLFDASSGKIKARIENLKGKSTFEVRTPTAICGARGTIMYVDVLPTMTKTFFEGGNGYILNVLNGINKSVGMGQSSYADNNGGMGNSTSPSDGERGDFTEGWNAGNGTEGYSSPGGGGGYLLGPDFANNNNAVLEQGYNSGLTGPFSDVPYQANTNNNSTVTPPVPTSFAIGLDGKFGRISREHHIGPLCFGDPVFLPDEGSSMSATLSADSLMSSTWGGILSATVSGATSNDSKRDFCRGTAQGTTNAGGQIYGWAGGVGFSDIWKGAISSLYIDPSGTAGVLFGHLAGEAGENIFSGLGDISIIPIVKLALTPEDLAASTVISSTTGNFDTSFNGGLLSTPFSRDLMSISGQKWGIWQDVYNGQYRNSHGLSTWSSQEGGRYDRDGYYIRTFEGLDNLNGNLTLDVMSTYMDYTTLGAYTGTMLGKYTAYQWWTSNFQGLGFGTWSETKLAWSAEIDAKYNNYYYHKDRRHYTNEVQYSSSSYNDGIIGALSSPFASPGTPVATVLIGDADTNGLRTWWGHIGDHSRAGDGSVMPEGVIAGNISKSNTVEGAMALLYIDAQGNAGTLTGDFSGSYMPDIDMWLAGGTMKATQLATGYNTAHYHVKENDIKGYFNGSFDDGGSIYNINNANIHDIDNGYVGSKTYSLARTSYGPAESWGVFNIELGGFFDKPANPTNNWTLALSGNSWAKQGSGHDYWIATINGDKWADAQVVGTLSGLSFASAGDDRVKVGIITGKTAGGYVDVETGPGTWQADTVGQWVEVSDLLNEHAMFGDNGLKELNKYVNVPITQVYSSIMTGAGSFAAGGSISATMAMNLYATSPQALDGIWTALLNGNFSGATSNTWTTTVTNGSNNVTLAGTHWDGGKWVANVSGTVGGNNITNGQAGGTYTAPDANGSGTFSGAGAGTYAPPVTPPQ